MASRIALPASKIKARRKKRLLQVIGSIMGLCVLLVAAVVGVMWIPLFRVSNVGVTGTHTVSEASLKRYVQDELSGTYGLIFPKNNILLYPKKKIIADLLLEFPTIQSASLRLDNFHTLTVRVIERGPVAQWCGEEISPTQLCYFLDANGTAYTISPVYSDNTYVRYYGALATTTPARQYLPPQEFQLLTALIAALQAQEKNDSIQTVALDSGGDVHAIFSNGFILIFSLDQKANDVVNKFSLALTTDPFTVHSINDFAYLDLRFGDKLYYKLK